MKRIALALAAVLVAAGLSAAAAPAEAQSAPQPAAAKDVTAHLFQWPWTSVADECRHVLGPAGYGAVQVSPPQEHVVLPSQPWWQAYQPVSYTLDSRYGTPTEFAAMISECHQAGVKVYADAVINHMAGQANGGVGSAGTSYGYYSYPGLYQYADFHHCGRNGNDWIQNWNDRWEIQNCQLVGLSDLATETDHVRNTIAGYLNHLLDLGVDGFRIDAAKHIPATDLAAISAKLVKPAYLYQEVLDGGPISKDEYLPIGSVIEDRYGTQLSRTFKSGQLSWLQVFGEAWGFSPGPTAVTYVDSHDTERDTTGATLTYRDGPVFDLATTFELAWPYGHPLVLSSYVYNTVDDGPPAFPVRCGGMGGWLCQDRDPSTRAMVGFRNTVSGAPVSRWWTNGANAVAFAREGKGYVVINREQTSVSRAFDTGLAAGTYCDLLHSISIGSVCVGQAVTVGSDGMMTATIPGLSAVAIDAAHRLNISLPQPKPAVTFDVYTPVQTGERLYVVGGTAALGNWDPAKALPMNAVHYPTWHTTAAIPAGTAFDYKYIRKSADGAVTWESRPVRTGVVPNDGWLSFADAWNAGATVQAHLTLHVTADPGQSLYIVGSVGALGNWSPSAAVPLTQLDASTWQATLTLPGSQSIEYKYIRKTADGTVTWESDPNRQLTTPSGGTITLDETWR